MSKEFFDLWFEVFDQKFVMIDDCIVLILQGNNRIKCGNGVKRTVSVFDLKFSIKKN